MKHNKQAWTIAVLFLLAGCILLGGWQINNGGGGGGAPSGPAGGDLGSTYPNPTVVSVNDVTTGTLPAANGGVAQVTTSNTGGTWFPSITMYTGTTTSTTPVNANQAVVQRIVLPYTQLISNITYNVVTLQASSHCDFGVYTAAGSLVVHTGSVSCATSGAAKAAAVTPATLNPGVYYSAWCTDNVAVAVTAVGSNIANGTLMQTAETGSSGVGPAAGCTAGVLNATLGTVTNNATPSYAIFYATP